MYKNDGLYLFLEGEQMQRTLVVKGKQRNLPVRSIADEIMGFSELDFRPYAESLDRLSILSQEVELVEEDSVGAADMEKFCELIQATDDFVNLLIETNPLHGWLVGMQMQDQITEDDGTAYYAYITKHKIITCLSWIMEFHMELNHILYLLQNKTSLSALSENKFLSELSCTQIVSLGEELKTQYFFRSLPDYYHFLLLHFIAGKPNVQTCECCGCYFIPKTKRKTLYCDRIIENEKTCKQIAPALKHKIAAEEKTVIQEFDRAKQRMYKRYERNELLGQKQTKKSLLYSEYYQWLDAAAQARDDYLNGKISEEEALQIIKVP